MTDPSGRDGSSQASNRDSKRSGSIGPPYCIGATMDFPVWPATKPALLNLRPLVLPIAALRPPMLAAEAGACASLVHIGDRAAGNLLQLR